MAEGRAFCIRPFARKLYFYSVMSEWYYAIKHIHDVVIIISLRKYLLTYQIQIVKLSIVLENTVFIFVSLIRYIY